MDRIKIKKYKNKSPKDGKISLENTKIPLRFSLQKIKNIPPKTNICEDNSKYINKNLEKSPFKFCLK